MKIVFKNGLESEFVTNAMNTQMEVLKSKHPELEGAEAIITAKMDNSPVQAGPDSYTVSIVIQGSRRLKNFILTKTEGNFYTAMHSAFHALAQKLSKLSEKRRVLNRRNKRQFKQGLALAEVS